jgi:GntR family transcriptional regulator
MARPSTLSARLAAAIDPTLDRPLARQLAEHVWLEVIDGTLEPGERLPTVRQLAVDLNIAPRIVERAFAELERRGVVRIEPGGAYVCLIDTELTADEAERARALEQLCVEAAERAEQLGFGIDDLIDALGDLRLGIRSKPGRSKESP